jgi:uncharacterized protein HemY
VENIQSALKSPAETLQALSPETQSKLARLKMAIEEKDMEEIDRLIAEAEKLPLSPQQKELVSNLSDRILMGKYPAALEVLVQLQKTM